MYPPIARADEVVPTPASWSLPVFNEEAVLHAAGVEGDVPDEPLEPLVPFTPDVPDVPDPEVPLEPDVPDPLVPDVPLEPDFITLLQISVVGRFGEALLPPKERAASVTPQPARQYLATFILFVVAQVLPFQISVMVT
jgi:hypothetical protein